MGKIRLMISAALVLLAVIIVLQNMETAETDILFFTVEMPRAILLACTALIGFVAGLLVSLKFR